jgi:16S rRNA (uracil1498-N3)-methyltransferase
VLRPRFHTGQSLAPGELVLEAGPSRHISRTLRMRPGDALAVFDGRGREAPARIEHIGKDRVTLVLGPCSEIDRESALAITLAIAVSRGDRMDTVVQKATELGVHRIRPTLSERTGVKLDPKRWEKKLRHWQQIAVSACEQCGRNRLPDIEEPRTLASVLVQPGDFEQRLLLHPAGDAAPLPAACASACLLVGPEGGFSDSEVAAAVQTGYLPLQLGPRVLRTETAPLAALSVLQARWGDLLQ